MVNGNIVVDDQSLQVDRHANAAEEAESVEEVEENDLTRRVTSASWSKRKKGEQWNEEMTDRFYQGLRMFGTDFMIISKMFLGRTRRQIKLKFTKEERIDPQRIQDALLGPREPMDLTVLTSNADVEYEDPAEFQRQLDQEAQEHAEEQIRLEEQAQETLRRKRAENAAAIAAGTENIGGNSNAADTGVSVPDTDQQVNDNEQNTTGKRKGRGKKAVSQKPTKPKKKKMHSRFGGGEEAEIVGSIDGGPSG